MKEYGINVGKANAVFEQIESDKYSEDEKLRSILVVLDMPTHNGIKKDTIAESTSLAFRICDRSRRQIKKRGGETDGAEQR